MTAHKTQRRYPPVEVRRDPKDKRRLWVWYESADTLLRLKKLALLVQLISAKRHDDPDRVQEIEFELEELDEAA